MSSGWPIIQLVEAIVNHDVRRIPIKESDRRKGPFPYYGASGIVDHVGSYIFDGEYLLIAEDGENLKTRKTPVAFLASGKFWVNNHAHIVEGNKRARTRFLSYALLAADFEPYLTGAVMPKLTQGNLNRIPIPLPSIPEQDAIIGVLNPLDDKIELNRRLNETLEALAQAIFRDWFVDFGPVRRKQEGITDPVAILGGLIPDPTRAPKTAALFPATFGDDGLPDGWTIGNLDDIALASSSTVDPAAIDPTTPYIGLEHMPRKSIMLDDWGKSGSVTSNKAKFEKGQILFGKLRPYFHKVGIAPLDGVSSTDIIILDAKRVADRPMVACCVSTDNFVSFTDRGSDGTKMPRTSWSKMKLYSVAISPESVRNAFSELVFPLHEKIVGSIGENRTLAETRDYLLPKLMSGEVRVRDAEEMVEDQNAATSQEAKSGTMIFGADLFGAPMLSPDHEIERDAVMVASVVKSFQRGRDVVGNVRMQKGCYFTRRRAGLSISSFDKKAAGPYDATLNHEGGKPEAIAKGWIMESTSAGGGKVFDGSVPGAKAREAETLVNQYGLAEAIGWVTKHLASKGREELECLATVDFAMQTLRTKGHTPTLQLVKADIAGDAEWKPKLSKPHFFDSAIQQAMTDLDTWLNEAKS